MNENISSLLLEIDIKRERLRNIPPFKRRRVIKDPGYSRFIYSITEEYHTLNDKTFRGYYSYTDVLGDYLKRLNDYLSLFENT